MDGRNAWRHLVGREFFAQRAALVRHTRQNQVCLRAVARQRQLDHAGDRFDGMAGQQLQHADELPRTGQRAVPRL